MRAYHAVLGTYTPSFFMAKINTGNRLDNAIPFTEQITLIHEYVHFIDDISTTFGLNNFCQNIDILKCVINTIYNSHDPVTLPFSPEALSNTCKENNELFRYYLGDNKYENLFGNCLVEEVTKNPIVTQIYNNEFDSYKIRININDVEQLFYNFGSACISESLARIIERRFCATTVEQTSLPYDSALLVAGKLYPQITNDLLNVAALCEVSLMTYNPGQTFVDALIEMKKCLFKPTRYDEIYEFVNEKFRFEGGLKIEEVYCESINMAKQQALDIFTVEQLSYCSELLVEYFEKAYSARLRNKLFITESISSINLDQVNSSFIGLFHDIGLPFLFNDDGMCFVEAKNNAADAVQYYHAVKAILDVILCNRPCDMLEICSNSTNNMQIDFNCRSSPWRRSSYQHLCPFGVMWRSWGLDGKELNPS